MIENRDLEKLVLEQKRNKNKKLSKVEFDKRIIDWQLFYLNNLDIFVTEHLELPLHYFQRQLLLDCWKNDIEYIIASRGLSKSWTIAILALSLGLLLPGIQIGISSATYGQSNKIINEKIDDLLTSEKRSKSNILKQLRRDKYIQIKNNDSDEGKQVIIGNGARIFAVCCGENGRGSRTNISILDEAVIVNRKYYDRIVEPMLEPYKFNGLIIEPKQIFMTSAKTKDKWVWSHLIKCVNGHYKDKIIKYGFFAGDIFMAVANGIQTKKQYISRRDNTEEFAFEEEYLNIWHGESENSMFSFESFHRNQINEDAFYPRNTEEILMEKVVYNFDKFDVCEDNYIRYLTMDIAVSGGKDNDNTVFTLGKLDKNTFLKYPEYIKTFNGVNSLTQVLEIKRLFYEYKCVYFVMDSKGVGNVFFDILTEETIDSERGITYPAWTVCMDSDLQISSDNVLKEKSDRTLNKATAKQVIIPIAGTSEINSQMHLTMMKSLKDNNIKFLKDDGEKDATLFDKNNEWILYTSEQKRDILLPFVETRYMINEAISLNTEYKDGNVKVKEDRSATKDRYMCMAMFNYFGEKLVSKYKKDNSEEDFDEDDFADIYDL